MAEKAARVLTLLTDYGAGGPFVGALHAVACRLAPEVRVIDLDHSVPPHDVRVGALRLERFVAHLPRGVHVAVVDPGVGTTRRPVAVRSGEQFFVGPDNGLLAWALDAAGGAVAAVEISAGTPRSSAGARTFDGRDVFVPAGCHLARGLPLESLGPPLDPATLVRLERPEARRLDDGALVLEVAQVDVFGNLQFAGDARDAASLGLVPGDLLAIETADGRRLAARYGTAFADVGQGDLVLLVDSDGRLALARNRGRAVDALGLPPDSAVVVRAGALVDPRARDPHRRQSDEGP